MRRVLRSVTAAALFVIATAPAWSAPITIADFAPGSTLLSFDEFTHGTYLSTEFASLGVILESGEPLGPTLTPNPADWLPPGGSVAPFVWVSIDVYNGNAASLPNLVFPAVYVAPDDLVHCGGCRIIVSFLDPLPTQVGLYIADADIGQTAAFSGPNGLLYTGVADPSCCTGSGDKFFVGFEDPLGISSVVLTPTPSGGLGLDDLRFGSPIPEPSTAALVMIGLIALGVVSPRHNRRPPHPVLDSWAFTGRH